MKITRLATLAIAVLVLAGPAGAANRTWQQFGGSYSGNWSDPNHWDTVPVAGDLCFFNFTSPTLATVTLTANTPNLGPIYAQGGSNRQLEIQLAGNTLTDTVLNAPVSGYGGVVTLKITSSAAGGTVSTSGGLLILDSTPTAISSAYVTIADDVQASFGSSRIGSAMGTNQQGGEAYLNLEDTSSTSFGGAYLWVGRANGANTPTNATLTVSDSASLTVTPTATIGRDLLGTKGSLTIDGGSTTVGFGTLGFELGTFTVVLDHATNFNKVTVAGNLTILDDGDDGDVILDIDLDGVTPAGGQIFDVMSYGVNRTGQFTLAAEDVGEWNVIYNDANKLIQIEKVATVAIPEPATLALLLTGVAVVVRRRRKA